MFGVQALWKAQVTNNKLHQEKGDTEGRQDMQKSPSGERCLVQARRFLHSRGIIQIAHLPLICVSDHSVTIAKNQITFTTSKPQIFSTAIAIPHEVLSDTTNPKAQKSMKTTIAGQSNVDQLLFIQLLNNPARTHDVRYPNCAPSGQCSDC